jgi:hypothetical protein
MRKPLPPIAAPFLVALPGGRRIRARLRPDAAEAAALRALGETLGSLAGRDLAAACRGEPRAPRKQALTKESSSRWAGAITRTSDDLRATRRRNLLAERRSLGSAIGAIEKRLAVPSSARGGYRSQFERFAKQQRLQQCKARLVEVQRQLSQRDCSIVRGGRRLLNTRHNLATAGLSEREWRGRWSASRLFLTADGESGKRFGNETIRVSHDGLVQVKTAGGHLTLAEPIAFNHHAEEWLQRVSADQCVRYDISFDPENGRWYLDASWGLPPVEYPHPAEVLRGGVLGVDLNADHLAAWQLDPSGNPVAKPIRIELDLKDLSASTRDPRIREVCSELVPTAKRLGLKARHGATCSTTEGARPATRFHLAACSPGDIAALSRRSRASWRLILGAGRLGTPELPDCSGYTDWDLTLPSKRRPQVTRLVARKRATQPG